jgi:two-component system LytT family response regulator
MADENNLDSGKRLRFRSHSGRISIEIGKILFIKGEKSYSIVFLDDEARMIQVSHNLGYIQAILEDENFLRCHDSWLVSMSKITCWFRPKKLIVVANFGIPVSRRKWTRVCDILSDRGIKAVIKLDQDIVDLRKSETGNKK